jgi:hypothetical protein
MSIQRLENDARDLREKLLQHPLFPAITDIHALRVFMEHHVYAVWDFMSLLKRLQRELTCVELPWMPGRDSHAARLINDIVLGEETDADNAGGFNSHYEIYLAAMEDVGADTTSIRRFVMLLADGIPLNDAFQWADVPPAAARFTRATLDIACHGSLEEVLGYFFHGREDMIPDLFTHLLSSWQIDPKLVPGLVYYLERHIHLDKDEHGPAAQKLIRRLLQSEASQRRLYQAAQDAITLRIELWNGVLHALQFLAPVYPPLRYQTTVEVA